MKIYMAKRWRGFTLFELLITLSILAIVSVISVPAIHHLVITQRRASSEQRLSAALQFARSMAISQGQFVTVCPSQDALHCIADWQNPLLIFTDANDKGTVDINDRILRHVPAIEWGQLQLKAFGSNRFIRFHPNGMTDNQNGTFSFCYQQQGWQVIVNRAGRVRSKILDAC